MLKYAKIKEYGCLKDVDVPLGDFNVLIGKNNTGKTTFLKAIQRYYSHDFNIIFPERKREDYYNRSLAEEMAIYLEDKNVELLPHSFLSMLYPQSILFSHSDNVLLLESPECGVHYSCLKGITEFLRCLSVGKLKKIPKAQVIITTYSPYLLDYCSVDEVLVFHKDENDNTKIFPMNMVKGIKEWIGVHEYSLGELWGNWGEEDFFRRATQCDTK